MKKVVILGAGNNKTLKLMPKGTEQDARDITTIDIDPATRPDHVMDLNNITRHWFPENSVDEFHAYEVLEHIGMQGNWRGFFHEFNCYWHFLKPGGVFLASVPRWDGKWAWSDPGHTRVISPGTLSFLSQKVYEKDVGRTTMTDYRAVYHGDFELIHSATDDDSFYFGLKAIKREPQP